METFEERAIHIYNSTVHTYPILEEVTAEIYGQEPIKFLRETFSAVGDERTIRLLQIYDILLHDYHFSSIGDYFFCWLIQQDLPAFSQQEIERMRAEAVSHLDFYEVEETRPGKGFTARSLMTNESIFISDISSSQQLVKWDICMSRVFTVDGVNQVTGALIRFAPDSKAFITATLLQRWQEMQKKVRSITYAEFCKKSWSLFYLIERRINERKRNIKLNTPYGDFKLCTLFYKVTDSQAIIAIMANMKEFSEAEESLRPDRQNKQNKMKSWSLSIQEEGPLKKELRPLRNPHFNRTLTFGENKAGSTVGFRSLAAVTLDPYLMRIEVQSAELADFFKGWFERNFSGLLQYKRMEQKDMAKLLAERKFSGPVAEEESSQPSGDEEELFADIKQQAVREYMEDWALRILDEPIPMLKNHSPRQAAKEAKLRPLLEEWLRGLENAEARKQQHGDYSISVPAMRKKLGM